MDFHHSSGTIIYDPYRGDMKRRTNGWCVIDVDKEITRYYRWWLQYQYHIRLQPPSWDAHISVVRGEKIDPQYRNSWKKYHGKKINFVYRHVGEIKMTRSGLSDSPDDGIYYYINVDCPTFDDIRNELGLRTGWSFHLTVGRTYEYIARKPKR